jgi:hypothetical protein
MLKLVSRTSKVVVLIKFEDGSDEGLQGVVWTGLSGIPTQVECA